MKPKNYIPDDRQTILIRKQQDIKIKEKVRQKRYKQQNIEDVLIQEVYRILDSVER